MWLVWGFSGIPKVAAIRLRRPYITAECMFVCNIFQPAFQLKKENNVLGSGSLYLMAALRFCNTNTLVPLQCKSSTSIFQDKKAQTLSSLLHMVCFRVSAHATVQWLKNPTNLRPNITKTTYLPCPSSPSLHLYLGLFFIKMDKILTILTKNRDKSFCKVNLKCSL